MNGNQKMKRSEMIKRLQKRFWFGDGEVIADLADEIIDFLVDQGMLPPAYEKKTQIRVMPYNDVWTSKKPVNEWEPENDQHWTRAQRVRPDR